MNLKMKNILEKKIKTEKMNDDILERNFIEFILKKMLNESKKSETKKDL